jgi:hypothetical protein
MPNLTRKFNSGGWTFDYTMLAKGGLVLNNVRHDGYNLARDIRVVGIWINPEETGAYQFKSLALGTDDFANLTSDPSHPVFNPSYLRYTGFNAPSPFDVYTKPGLHQAAGVQAIYKSNTRVFGDDTDSDDDYLVIDQSFIFTKYGKNPAHEPGGILEAARVFPLLKFSYGGKKIKSIRVDYRFDIALDLLSDPFLNTDVMKILPRVQGKEWLIKHLTEERPMLAGVFRDQDELLTGVKTEDVFYAGEKPVLRELVAYGLKKGIPGERLTPHTVDGGVPGAPVAKETTNEIADGDKSTWDNIHMWSNYRLGNSYLKKQPSAPGAFHALHCHWRWPYYTGYPSLLDRIIAFFGNALKTWDVSFNSFGEKQFQGVSLSGHIGGPLLDHKIPTQTIHFAITLSKPKDKTNKWDADQVQTTQKFEELFFDPETEHQTDPTDISRGEHVVTWISVKVERDDEKKFEGTVLAHGLYFAHNVELTPEQSAFAKTIGETLQKPKYPKPTWIRSPNGK